MGPSGQAQYYARDLAEAYEILLAHYRFTYRAPGVPLRTYYYRIIPMAWGQRVELVMLLSVFAICFL